VAFLHLAFGSMKRTAPLLARGPISRSDDVSLPEPPHGSCLGINFAEWQVVITQCRQLIPVLEATILGDPACDSDPAGPVQNAV